MGAQILVELLENNVIKTLRRRELRAARIATEFISAAGGRAALLALRLGFGLRLRLIALADLLGARTTNRSANPCRTVRKQSSKR